MDSVKASAPAIAVRILDDHRSDALDPVRRPPSAASLTLADCDEIGDAEDV